MADPSIEPSTITTPIQLLAAWLVGLILTNTAFLTAAAKIKDPKWVPGVLTVSAVLNVPLFLVCLFLLQTYFRPELQEDVYYSHYLEARISGATGKAEIVQAQQSGGITTGAAVAQPTPLPTDALVFRGVDINDLLKDYSNIVAELKKSNIAINNTFGTTSLPAGRPEKFIVSFTGGNDIKTIQTVMKICERYGLDGINYVADTSFGIRLYIGAYGNITYHPIASLEPSKLFSASLTMDQLIVLLKGAPTNNG